MTEGRVKELYDKMLFHISELVSGSDLVDTLHCIGFTDEEIIAEGFEIEKKENPSVTMTQKGGNVIFSSNGNVSESEFVKGVVSLLGI